MEHTHKGEAVPMVSAIKREPVRFAVDSRTGVKLRVYMLPCGETVAVSSVLRLGYRDLKHRFIITHFNETFEYTYTFSVFWQGQYIFCLTYGEAEAIFDRLLIQETYDIMEALKNQSNS
jgi:hypothetical protein